jgi:hypothetical protein
MQGVDVAGQCDAGDGGGWLAGPKHSIWDAGCSPTMCGTSQQPDVRTICTVFASINRDPCPLCLLMEWSAGDLIELANLSRVYRSAPGASL